VDAEMTNRYQMDGGKVKMVVAINGMAFATASVFSSVWEKGDRA
jgi:hypothetical protein